MKACAPMDAPAVLSSSPASDGDDGDEAFAWPEVVECYASPSASQGVARTGAGNTLAEVSLNPLARPDASATAPTGTSPVIGSASSDDSTTVLMDRTAEFLRRKALLADTAATRLHKDFSSFDLAAVHPIHLLAREVEALEAASGKGAKEGDLERGLAEACMAAWRSHEELAARVAMEAGMEPPELSLDPAKRARIPPHGGPVAPLLRNLSGNAQLLARDADEQELLDGVFGGSAGALVIGAGGAGVSGTVLAAPGPGGVYRTMVCMAER